jgi:hypothetical protein
MTCVDPDSDIYIELRKKIVFKFSFLDTDPHWIWIQKTCWIQIWIRIESIRIHNPGYASFIAQNPEMASNVCI